LGRSGVAATRDLKLSKNVLRLWTRELSAAPAAAFPGNGQMSADLAEITAFKKEVVWLPDILKKGEIIDRHWFKDNGRTLSLHARRHEFRLNWHTASHLSILAKYFRHLALEVIADGPVRPIRKTTV